MQEKITAGQNTDSYCGKCKVSREHTIMTMDGETAAKVRCTICGSMHKYKNPLDALKVRKPRSKKDDPAAAEVLWATGLAEAKGKERVYDMTSKYRIGDIVNHHTFGKGVVMKVHCNKCDMLFKDKERLMASTNQ
jgi:hypothetical protein